MKILGRDGRRTGRLLLRQFVEILNSLRKLDRLIGCWVVYRNGAVRGEGVKEIPAQV